MEKTMVQENLMEFATREKLAGRVEVLDKVKALFLLPQLEMMTLRQVADYYEVEKAAAEKCYQRNKNEIDSDGTVLESKFELNRHFVCLGYKDSVSTFDLGNGVILKVPNRGIRMFSKRAILRIGMLLRDSAVAREVRTQLLNTFEKTDDAQKVEDIETEQEVMGEMGLAFAAGDIAAFCQAAMKYNAFKQRHIDRLTVENAVLIDNNNKLAEVNREQTDTIKANMPKVEYAEACGSCKGTVSVGVFAKSLYGYRGINMGRNRMFDWLRNHYILDHDNIPYQKYIDNGWFKVSQIPRADIGRQFSVTRITPKGQQKLFEMIRSEMPGE